MFGMLSMLAEPQREFIVAALENIGAGAGVQDAEPQGWGWRMPSRSASELDLQRNRNPRLAGSGRSEWAPGPVLGPCHP